MAVKNTLKMLAIGAVMAAGLGQNANASALHFFTTLLGSNESPPNASPGTGTVDIFWDTSAQTMEVKVLFSGLLGNTTASHIHCCTASPFLGTAGVATVTPTFTGFPSGVTSGAYDNIFDMTLASSYNPSFVTGHGGTVALAEAAFFAGLVAGETYLNIHTSVVPGGEIRGFIRVPEPGSLTLMLGGLTVLGAGIFAARRKRRAA